MRCPNCQKLILNNTPRCPYCGQAIASTNQTNNQSNSNNMFNNNPMPNTSEGVSKAEHYEAVAKEVKKRHWQRYVFYGLIVVLLLGATWLIVKIYNDNTALIASITDTKNQLAQVSENLTKKTQEADKIDQNLKQAQDELNKQTEQYKKDTEVQAASVKDLEQCKLDLTASDANIYNLILTLGVGIKSADLKRIPVADANLNNGVDTDKDGLSDEVEKAIGTDPNKADTDGDGYTDKDELIKGFDPLVKGGKLPIDKAFSDKQKGKILINIEGSKDAWYVSPANGQRYFLGYPADGYRAMRSIEFWTKNYKSVQ